jgi:hypothetical protein
MERLALVVGAAALILDILAVLEGLSVAVRVPVLIPSPSIAFSIRTHSFPSSL